MPMRIERARLLEPTYNQTLVAAPERAARNLKACHRLAGAFSRTGATVRRPRSITDFWLAPADGEPARATDTVSVPTPSASAVAAVMIPARRNVLIVIRPSLPSDGAAPASCTVMPGEALRGLTRRTVLVGKVL